MLLPRKVGPAIALLALFTGSSHASSPKAQPPIGLPSGSASAERPPTKKKRVPARLSSAIRLYQLLEYEAALEQLRVARSAPMSTDDLILAWLYEGIILANLGLTELSHQSFRTALRLLPSASLPVSVSPKIAQAFEEVRKEFQKASPSSDTLVSAPSEPSLLSSPQTQEAPTPSTILITSSPSVTPPAQFEETAPSPSSKVETPPVMISSGESSPRPSQMEQAASGLETGTPHSAPPLQPFMPSTAAEKPDVETWAPEEPARSRTPERVRASQAAVAIGAILAATSIIMIAASGSTNPENQSTLQLTGGLVGLGGLVLCGAGIKDEVTRASSQSFSHHSIQPGLSLRRQLSSVGARVSF